MINKCESCAHWKRYSTEDAWYDEDEPLKVNPDDFGKCTAVTFDFWQKEGNKPFYVMDASDYKATLTTNREFACNQHSLQGGAYDHTRTGYHKRSNGQR